MKPVIDMNTHIEIKINMIVKPQKVLKNESNIETKS